jgi:hypothetical protein
MQPAAESYLLPIISNNYETARRFILDLFETQFLVSLLMKHSGNLESAAATSGLSLAELEGLVATHEINLNLFRK